MNRIAYQLQKMVYELEETKKEYISELDVLPEGHLIYCQSNGKKRFYQAKRDDGNYTRKSIGGDQALIEKLSRKEYLEEMVKRISDSLDKIRAAAEKASKLEVDQILRSMPKAYQALPARYFFNEAEESINLHLEDELEARCRRHKEWGDQPYEKSSFMPEYLQYMTSAGFKVRSKDEALIVEQILGFGVPTHYEQIIHFGARTIVPDFTFQDKNGDEFYWEHAGMMGDPAYAARHKKKMEMYESFGIVPWKNLIVTYDIDGDLNIPFIKSIIRYEVIPRL